MTVNKFNQVKLDSTYLDDYRNAIRSKSLPWDGFARSGLISPKDAASLTSLEKLTVSKGEKVTDEKLLDYATTIFGILDDKNLPIERNDVLKFNLVILSDLLNTDEFIKVLTEKGLLETGLKALSRHAENSDEIIKLLAIYDSIVLLINLSEKSEFASTILTELLNFLKVRNFNLKFLALNLISEFLLNSHKQYRTLIWAKHEDLLPILFQNLNEQFGNDHSISTNDLIQLQYKILLIIWILSFEKKELSNINKFYLNDLLSLLRILKISIKEKIIRLIISIFINLTNDEGSSSSLEIVKFLILNGDFISILNNLKERKWSDDELISDLDVILEISLNIFDKLTSFDEYLQELTLKNFRNSPVHFKEEFFIDNLSKFQDSNYKIFKELLEILDDKRQESLSLKLLLSDLEKILKIDSNSLSVLIKANKKTSIMELLNHKNSDVRYQALKITQFLVSQSLK